MRFRLTSLLLFVALAVAGCDSTDTSDDARLRVLLTDAPGDFERAVVTIDRIYLQRQGSDDDPEGSRVILRDDPVTVDLLTLQNEVLDLVEDEIVPEGTYRQLRLVISGGFIEVEEEDGSSSIYASSDAYAAEHGVTATGRLQMPSYSTSGLKINLPNEVAEIEGDENIVLIDFNVAESFGRQAGNSGMWVMHPVVHATDLAFTGRAHVSLSLDEGVTLPVGVTLADFSAELDKDGDVLTVPFADEDDDGVYTAEIRYLFPALYPVTLAVPEGLAVETDLALPLDVTVTSGGIAQAALVITAVTER